MAILNVKLPDNTPICNGKQITFRAPCDCEGVTGINIDGDTYDLLSTVNEPVSKGGTFISGALVSVIIDTDNNKAYIQNSPSDTYIYTKHWWSVLNGNKLPGYKEVLTPVTTETVIGKYQQYDTGDDYSVYTSSYSKEIEFSLSGEVKLKNAVSHSPSSPSGEDSGRNFANSIIEFAPCYISVRDESSGLSRIYFIPEGATYSTESYGSTLLGAPNMYENYNDNDSWVTTTYKVSLCPEGKCDVFAYKVTSEPDASSGSISYVQSTNRDAYPDNGIVGSNTYTYIGIPLEKTINGAQIVTGSYIGTGVYGTDNPVMIETGFKPRFMFITSTDYIGNFPGYNYSSGYDEYDNWHEYPGGGISYWQEGNSNMYTANGNAVNRVTTTETGISWYTNGSTKNQSTQLNSYGIKYNYIIIG